MRNEKYGFTTYEVRIVNTGYAMDGHRAIVACWDYDPLCYHLHGWFKEDDEAFEKSMYESLKAAYMLASDDFESFHSAWESGEWSPDGIFVLSKDQIEIIKET